MTYKKKLIEVALPLPEINDASAYDKMPGIGPHPKGIHHWWARLPLPVARAILFASTVDDPSEHPDKWRTEESQNAERERLFGIIRDMMAKRLHKYPHVYAKAKEEIQKHCGGKLPAVLDPFAGGGSIPLEANRLGFETHAGDLNPVAVLLNKCNLELAPRWVGRQPVNPESRDGIGGKGPWEGTSGLAADVRYYGRIIRDRARKKIGHLYPNAKLPDRFGAGQANVIAWIWARTVASPDPAALGTHVPLLSTFWLSSKKGSEVWLSPVLDKEHLRWTFDVRTGPPASREAIRKGTKTGKGGFTCILTGAPIPFEYVRSEGTAGRLGSAMVAQVVQMPRSRVYLPADPVHIGASKKATPSDFPDTDLPDEALGFRIQNYGIRKHWQMFTNRQLTAMVALSDLVKSIREEVQADAQAVGFATNDANAYASTVTTFLALALDRCADFNNALCRWKASGQQSIHLFSLQAIPMVWDFVEPNIMGEKAVSWQTAVDICADSIETISCSSRNLATSHQIDAASGAEGLKNLLVSTDPPYYDNIGYAALSDFFYIWLRRTIGDLYPDLFSTVLVPKMSELTAAPERFDGDKNQAKEHFESGFMRAFTVLRQNMDPRFPLTVYYAFKQTDEENEDEAENSSDTFNVDTTTGWETLLQALITSGFRITATWPVRASQTWRMRAMGSNALASYIVLACRRRDENSPSATRREFIDALKHGLPDALRHLRAGNVAPVDLAQSAIGPGMGIYTSYSKVVDTEGKPLTVRDALALINQTLDEVLAEQEGDFDADSRWAVAWFEQNGFAEGEFGVAETLSKAKNTSIAGMVDAGVVESKRGKVRLLKPAELPNDWDPATDTRLTAWETVHHLIRNLESGGDSAAAELAAKLGSKAETARELAYRLYTISERKKRASDALSYNALVQSWPEIQRLARERGRQRPTQTTILDEGERQ